MKLNKWIVMPAALALGVSSFSMAQNTNRDREERDRETARERRQEQQRQENRQERRADQTQGGVPDRVTRALQQRYPKSDVGLLSTEQRNGVPTYQVRVKTDQGETTARATERGDFLYLGYPGVSADRLPRPVTSIVEGMFNGRPESVNKYEHTSYLVNANFGNKSYQLQINPVGRIMDVKPAAEVKRDDPTQGPRASRDDEQALQPRLDDYFTDPKVKSVHRYPEAEGYFWVNLSTATEDDVWVLMDTKRDVAEYRTRVNDKDIPPAVNRAIRETFKGAKADEVYRHNLIQYNVLMPLSGDEAALVAITPLGDVRHIRQAGGTDIRREFAEREPDELFRNRQRDNRDDDRDNRNNADRNNPNRTNRLDR